MHIKLTSLQRAKPKDVIRLAHFVGLTSFGKTLEQIIEEVHFEVNYSHLKR